MTNFLNRNLILLIFVVIAGCSTSVLESIPEENAPPQSAPLTDEDKVWSPKTKLPDPN